MQGGWIRRLMFSSIAVVGGLAALAPQAFGAARPFEQRFSTNDTGDIEIVANTLLTCPDSDPRCAAARAGTASGSALNNNAYVMQYVNVDPAAPASVFNSSSADLSLPTGATVLRAMLYYGGDSNAGSGGAAPPDATARDTVLLKAPGASSYQSLTALQVDDTSTSGNDFQGIVDVTDQVVAAGSGTYWVANVQAGSGRDRQAGWSLVVAYRDTSQPPRNLSIFDGFQIVNSGNPNVSIPVSGFQTPPSGPVRTQLGFVAYEGDAGSSGDSAKLNTTTLSDATNPASNFFNSAISHAGAPFTAKDPDYVNQLGYDSILAGADGVLANGDTSAVIRLTTGGETYFPGAVTFATELFAPDVQLTKAVEDLNGGSVQAGDTLRYTVTATNAGPDDATNMVIRDPVPANATFVAGSLDPAAPLGSFDADQNRAIFHVGAGATAAKGGTLAGGGGTATASFDVTVNAVPSDTEIENAATASFFAQTLGAPLSADSNTVTSTVAAPDLTIAKTPADFTATVGDTQDFTLNVTNTGDAPTDGSAVTVTDAFEGVPPGAFDEIESISGTGWACTPATPASTPASVQCTRSGVLAAGASYPPIMITAQVGGLPNDNILNTASVAGGGDGDSTNNSSTATGQTTTRADLQLLKTADRATVLTGEQVTFTLRVRNGGPSAASAVQVADTDLAPNYSVDAVSSSQGGCTALPCDLGTLADGDEATVTITATVTATGASTQSIDNTATVSSTTTDPDPSNDSSTVTVDVAPTADLSVTKTASPDPLDSTLPASYTLTVHNDGPQTASNAVVVDQLPAGFVPAAVPAGCTHAQADNTVVCDLGDIASGADASVTIDGTLAASTAGTMVANSAITDSDTGDPDPTNNTTTNTTLAIPSADLELVKLADNPAPDPGGEVTFTLRLINHGPSVALNAQLTDTLPAGLTLVSAPGCTEAGGTQTCDAGSLDSGDSQDFPITVRVGNALAGQSVTNTANASSGTPDPIAANGTDAATLDVATITAPPSSPPPPPVEVGQPNLRLNKRADTNRVRAGDKVRWSLTVRNRGNAPATNVRLCDRLHGRLTVGNPRGGELVDGRRLCWTIQRVDPGERKRRRLVTGIDRDAPKGRLRNRASVTSEGLPRRRARASIRVKKAKTGRPSPVTG